MNILSRSYSSVCHNHLQKMEISVDEYKMSVSSMLESVESGEIMSLSSKWNLGLDILFDTYLNNNSENKIEKPINNYLDLFINTSLNHMSIRSRLVSQPKTKLISNSEQLFNATELLPITFGVIFPPNPGGKKLKNS